MNSLENPKYINGRLKLCLLKQATLHYVFLLVYDKTNI